MWQHLRKLVCGLFACMALLIGWAAPAAAVEGKWIKLAPSKARSM